MNSTRKNDFEETNEIRKKGKKELEDWIKSQSHCLSGCRTDSIFLLRFLRLKNFDMTDSIAMLIKYLTMRTKFPDWWKGLDIHEPKLNKMVSNGYLFVLPQCDDQGRLHFVFVYMYGVIMSYRMYLNITAAWQCDQMLFRRQQNIFGDSF